MLGFANAQRVLTGTVTDPGKAPLPGVTVIVKGTVIGTVTDLNGKFSLQVPDNSRILVFSFIGMKSQEVNITGSEYNITLLPDVIGLEEVVAIGYGTMKRSDLTGSVASISVGKFENERPQAVQDMLRSNIAGLEVGFSTSAKGGGSLRIRGGQLTDRLHHSPDCT